MIWTQSERIEETSMNEMKWINQYSKLILIQHTGMNQKVQPFEDLEYLNTIILLLELLSNVTERGLQKLYLLILIETWFGRSTFIHFQSFHSYFALSMNMFFLFFHKVNTSRVKCIAMKEDLFISFHTNSFNTLDYCWWGFI